MSAWSMRDFIHLVEDLVMPYINFCFSALQLLEHQDLIGWCESLICL
jgi:hypothetical protein